MNKKSFVSISFSTQKIQVLWMNDKKTSVISYKSYDLPDGAIVNHKINDFSKVINLLKQISKEMKFPTKYVGIILPEFATYTKLLTIPKLPENELHEAVTWQAQEFLPNNGANMIMDWKIVREVHNHLNILVYAIHYDVLAGFVDVVGRAGLFPLVVETPSLSLMRVSKNLESEPQMIIHVSYDETILIITFEESIVATSVARSSSQREIVQTAIRMLSHYGIDISKIQISGAQIFDNFLSLLKEKLKVEVNYLQKNVLNIENNDIQRYLMCIALQEKDTDAPRSPRTINLLPPNWEDHYNKKARDIELWTLSLSASLVVWVCFIAISAIYFSLGLRASSFEKEKNTSQSVNTEIYSEIELTNSLAKNTLNILSSNIYPQEVVNQIAEAKQDGVVIQNYSINFLDGTIKLSGFSSIRDSLVNFKNNLLKNSNFEEINIPIDILLKDFDFNFELSFKYKPLMKDTKKQAPKLNI